jgi:hypothetical protein
MTHLHKKVLREDTTLGVIRVVTRIAFAGRITCLARREGTGFECILRVPAYTGD